MLTYNIIDNSIIKQFYDVFMSTTCFLFFSKVFSWLWTCALLWTPKNYVYPNKYILQIVQILQHTTMTWSNPPLADGHQITTSHMIAACQMTTCAVYSCFMTLDLLSSGRFLFLVNAGLFISCWFKSFAYKTYAVTDILSTLSAYGSTVWSCWMFIIYALTWQITFTISDSEKDVNVWCKKYTDHNGKENLESEGTFWNLFSFHVQGKEMSVM